MAISSVIGGAGSGGGGSGAPTDATYITVSNNATLSNERVLSAGNLLAISDGGANNNLTLNCNLSLADTTQANINDLILFSDVSNSNANAKNTFLSFITDFLRTGHRSMFRFHTDFIQNPSTTATDGGLNESNTGTGAAVNNVNNWATNTVGVVELTTGTTATGQSSITSSNNAITLNGGEIFYEIEIRIPILSVLAEQYSFICGLGNTTNGLPANGIGFLYAEGGVAFGVASPNFQIFTRSTSVATAVTTAEVVNINTTYRLGFIVNADATSVEFFINGVSAGSITTNIPTSAQLGFYARIIKSAGTTARTAQLDCLTVTKNYTTPR